MSKGGIVETEMTGTCRRVPGSVPVAAFGGGELDALA